MCITFILRALPPAVHTFIHAVHLGNKWETPYRPSDQILLKNHADLQYMMWHDTSQKAPNRSHGVPASHQ